MADYISKNEALNLIMHNDKVCHYADERYENVVYATACRISDVVANMPAADVQPLKRGYWKNIMMSEATGWDLSLTGGRDEVCETVCSVCGDCCAFGGDGDLYLSNYCPKCGARMDGDAE